MLKCQVIMDAMERIAPRRLAEEWDNPGLLVGSPADEINKLLCCLDVTDAVIEEAIQLQADMIISHHPLIFRSMKNVRTDLPLGKRIKKLIKNDIAVFAAHTNLDSTLGGCNDMLAGLLGLVEVKPFNITSQDKLVKLAVYVPEDYADAVREAITRAGAGFIGNYSCCTFNTKGQGTFLPQEGTHPFIGQAGKLERVAEVKLETIMPEKITNKVVKAMLKVHPYEEAAYDLYPLNNPGQTNSLGRIGLLPVPMTLEELGQKAKVVLPADSIRIVRGNDRPIKKVALCTGSAADFIDKAAFAGADAYVTGDVRYHDAQRAQDAGINLIDAGHFGTEFPIADVLHKRLEQELAGAKGTITILTDTVSQDIFQAIK